MKLGEALRSARKLLEFKNIDDAPLEAELLLRHLLGVDRAQIYVNQDMEMTNNQAQAYEALIQRRINGEPSAYIVGHREFYGLDFYVDRSVLIPRPESELLVDKTLEFVRDHACLSQPVIADIGTGCGNLAISITKHLPKAKIYAIDISQEALEVAAINCQRHMVMQRIYLLRGNLLEPLPETVDIIVANLPYVKNKEMAELESNVRDFEPHLALDGGPDGLDYISQLLSQAQDKISKAGAIFLELGIGQGTSVADLAKKCFPQAEICLYPDLGGIDRVLALYL